MKININRKNLLIIIITFLILAIDQLIKLYIINNLYNNSKIIINGFLNLTYVENTGGAYGIGNNSITFYTLINAIVIGILAIFIQFKKEKVSIPVLISMSLIMSGGLGNLIDRVFRGYVVDYIDINPLFKYPVFNFADICIVLGVIYITFSIIINKEKL